MQEDGEEEAVELIGNLMAASQGEGQKAADLVQTVHLRAQRGVLVIITSHEVAVLAGGDHAFALDSDAARPSGHLARHVTTKSRMLYRHI